MPGKVTIMSDGDPGDATLSDRPVPALGLVSVTPDATTSRVLVRAKGGSVTLFAFAGGQELDEHTAPFDALVHVLEGELELTIDGARRRARAGEVALMPANVPHALRAAGDTIMLLTMLRAQA